jgi:hypothetical protein
MASAERQPGYPFEASPSATASETALPIPQVTKLLIQSFKHSQGESSLQAKIFRYLHQLHPDWRVDAASSERILVETTRAIGRLLPTLDELGRHTAPDRLTHIPVFEESILRHSLTEFSRLQACFNTPASVDPALPQEMAELVILRDCQYRRGRPHQPIGSSNRYRAEADPYLSYLCYYGLEQHSTGSVEFDLMYQEIVGALRDNAEGNQLDKEMISCLKEVVVQYYYQHSALKMDATTHAWLTLLGNP